MKAILKFDLSDGEDILAHLRCIKSLELTCALQEINEMVRRRLKYNSDEMSEETIRSMTDVQKCIHAILTDNGINLDELL